MRLIPRLTPLDAMPYLPDLTACIVRGCNHAAPQIVKEACNCALALATALYHEHYKASILKPYTEKLTLGLMYALYHKQARVRAQAVRALGMVRAAAIIIQTFCCCCCHRRRRHVGPRRPRLCTLPW